MRVLLTGWFSFSNCDATAGDLETKDQIVAWLLGAGIQHDVLEYLTENQILAFLESSGHSYTHLVVACGPFSRSDSYQRLLMNGMPHAIVVGVNLSMIDVLDDTLNGFDFLIERDSSRIARADLALGYAVAHVPVVGLILVKAQPEYRALGRHTLLNNLLTTWLASKDFAVVNIDTTLPRNEYGLHNAAQIESLIARMDVIITTRLHGLVLGLKNGKPVLAVDPISGGAKVTAQANSLNWQIVISADQLSVDLLDAKFQLCRQEGTRNQASQTVQSSRGNIDEIRAAFLQSIFSDRRPRRTSPIKSQR